MNPTIPRSIRLVVRWTARLLSLLSIGFMLMFIVGEGFNPFHLAPRELLLCLFFPIGVLLGLGLGWRWEALGGALTILCFAGFYGVHWLGSGRLPSGHWFAVLASPGLFFLLAALAGRRKAAGENA